MLPDTARLAAEVTGPHRDLTHRPGLAPVEPRWCHITVQDIAPVADVTPEELDRMVTQVRQACAELTPLQLTLGPPELGRFGVGCPVTPAAGARALWEITTATSREVTGARFPTRPARYHPHLSLAYGVALSRDEPLCHWLATHPTATMTFTATQLTLVAQSHDGARAITWRPVTTVPLNAPN